MSAKFSYSASLPFNNVWNKLVNIPFDYFLCCYIFFLLIFISIFISSSLCLNLQMPWNNSFKIEKSKTKKKERKNLVSTKDEWQCDKTFKLSFTKELLHIKTEPRMTTFFRLFKRFFAVFYFQVSGWLLTERMRCVYYECLWLPKIIQRIFPLLFVTTKLGILEFYSIYERCYWLCYFFNCFVVYLSWINAASPFVNQII